jgi:hypothetical protein
MPLRPPKSWFDRCVSEVQAHGGAVDPAKVCGAVWARKSASEKRAIVALEEGTTMAKKKKSKKTHGTHKLAGAALKAHEKAKKKGKAKKAHKPKAHKPKHAGHKRHPCAGCGHDRRVHAGRSGCAHVTGSTFCKCPGFTGGSH